MKKKAPYPAIDIAAYIVRRCNERGHRITNFQLQKILYFVSGEIFRKHHTDLIMEDFYCWSCGPVVPEVYELLCRYGGSPIPPDEGYDDGKIAEEFRPAIDTVVDKYIVYPVLDLLEETRQTEPVEWTYKIFG